MAAVSPSAEVKAGIRMGRAPLRAGEPILFLDRDGVIVEDVHYLHRKEDVRLVPGVASTVRNIRSAGIGVVIVTNQAGIARGLFSWAEYHAVAAHIEHLLLAEGAEVDLAIACPFHPEFTEGYSADHSTWRKPGPAMLHWARDEFGVDLKRSWLAGDNVTDIGAAHAAGLAGAVHVLTGHGQRDRAAVCDFRRQGFSVVEKDSLPAAEDFIKSVLCHRSSVDFFE